MVYRTTNPTESTSTKEHNEGITAAGSMHNKRSSTEECTRSSTAKEWLPALRLTG